MRIQEVGKGSWKKGEVGKFEIGKYDMKFKKMNLESLRQSWKVRAKVGKFGLKLKSTAILSNFGRNFTTPLGSFQLR